jgi:hypothetical protein
MRLGEWFNNHPMVGAIVALVILAVSGVVVFRTSFGSDNGRMETRYFYDVSSGELFAHDNITAPITTDTGSTAVWAHVYSCGACDDPSQRFAAYLHKFTDEAKQEMTKPKADRDVEVVINGGRYAAVPDEPGQPPQWVPVESAMGMRIAEMHNMRCAPNMPKPCSP